MAGVMRKPLRLLLLCLAVVQPGLPAWANAQLALEKGCLGCHGEPPRRSAPSLSELAAGYARYRGQDDAPRQLAAIYASGRRTDGMRAISAPTLVIHGTDDTLIAPSGGQRAAELIPNAKLDMIDDMGHDLPRPLWSRITGSIISHLKETPCPAR